MNTKEILILKKNLLKGLSENVFKEFTEEENNYLHSKHGKLTIDSKNSGIVGAFKSGITIILDTGFTITCKEIDWQNNRFLDIYDTWHKFEFVPIRLNELIWNMEAREQVEEGISATVVRNALRNDLKLEGLVPKCIIDAKFYLKEFILIYESKSN